MARAPGRVGAGIIHQHGENQDRPPRAPPPATLDAFPERARRIVFCSGKLYYDLLAERAARWPEGTPPVALLRCEQLYPWPVQEVRAAIARYVSAGTVVWAQEEPANMGGWTFVRDRFEAELRSGQSFSYAGRPDAASPSVGSMRIHREEQFAIVYTAFDGLD